MADKTQDIWFEFEFITHSDFAPRLSSRIFYDFKKERWNDGILQNWD